MNITAVSVGDRVWFEEERNPYTVQARNERFIVCTKPFAARKTVMYCIVDLAANIRGTDGFVFSGGYETREDCQQSLADFTEAEGGVSRRNRTTLNVRKTEKAKESV